MNKATSMNALVAAIFMAGAMLFAGTGTLDAQETEWSIGLFGGGFTSTQLNDTDEGQFFTEDNPPAELKVENSGLYGLQAEVWVTERFGIRADGAYSPAAIGLDQPDDTPAAQPGDGANVADLDVVLGDLNAMFRLLPADATLTPFVTAGGGFVHYDPAGDAPIVIDEANARLPSDQLNPAEGGNDETKLAGMIGVGFDVAPEDWPVTIRGELTDHFSGSPALLVLEDDEILPGGAGVSEDNEFRAVHNISFTLGLQWFPGEG